MIYRIVHHTEVFTRKGAGAPNSAGQWIDSLPNIKTQDVAA